MVSRRCCSMVKTKTILALLLTLLPIMAKGQNYYITDTVTEHNNFGTYYHDRFEGRKTANGEIFDQNKFTAAHWKIKLGTLVMVTNKNSGLQVIVKVNDRCPKHNVLDMSHRAANAIGIRGCQKVTVRILPEGNGYEERWAAQETMFDSVRTRLSNNPEAEPATKDKTEPVVKPDTTIPETKPAKPESPKLLKVKPMTKKPASQEYNLILATGVTHGEAFENIKKLPKAYQERVTIEPIEDSSHVRMTLHVRLSETQAKNLSAALKRKFPGNNIIPCE